MIPKNDKLVVAGAKMKCTMGDISSTLKVVQQFKYKVNGKKVATMFDMAPGPNFFPPIGTFGTCKPYKMLPPPASLCTPIPTGPWMMPFTKHKIMGKSIIKSNACIMCARGGGKISFQNSGQ